VGGRGRCQAVGGGGERTRAFERRRTGLGVAGEAVEQDDPCQRASLPDCLEVTAWTEDGEIMGLRHRTLAVEGVQFHPESILTEHGHALLKNFLD